MRQTVIGTGYLGATHAACMAELGYDVLGLDVDTVKVAALNAGEVPFYEPGLPEVLRRGLDSGRLRFTTSFAEVGEFADLHFLCVGTPQSRHSDAADLTQVESAVEQLAPWLTRPSTVVGKSTVPVGTAARLAQRLVELAPAREDVELAWNPEFLREGYAVHDTLEPDRIVIGVDGGTAEQVLREVYAPMLDAGVPLVVTDLPTAELVKTAANAFLATKISFINAMAEVCEATGADVSTLADAIGQDPRIGRRFLGAGLGFGGGCLPKDIRAFRARASEVGAGPALAFLDEVDAINLRRRTRTVELAREAVGGSLDGAVVGVLGAAFKPDSDDVRDSPALDVARAMHEQGAVVRVHDPQARDNARHLLPEVEHPDSIDDAVRGSDVVLLLTEWREFVAIDPVRLATLVRTPRVIDARNALDPVAWRAAGWTYTALGRPNA